MDKKLEIAINNYLNPNGLIGFLKKILYKFSKYEYSVLGDKNAEILIFINNEFILRNDHYRQAEYIFNSLKSSGLSVKFITAKRVISFTCNNNLIRQFQNVFTDIGTDFKKILVFCDSVPLQNFIVSKFNKKKIETYSLQHGFYAEDTNKVFLDVYKSSNAKNFFVWDERTLKFMKKHNPNRNYIKVGPHCPNNFDIKKKIFSNRIAIFGCGKDQKLENNYLCKIYNILYSKGLMPIFIAHPKFNLLDRFKFYIQNKIWISKNKMKNKSYRLSFVLNSTVFLELQENCENYFILNKNFNKMTIPDLDNLIKSNYTHDISDSTLKPFLNHKDSLELIIKKLNYDL